jgi:hypothetical protein
MDATKTLLILMLAFPIILFGQKTIYPKDTIYIKYESKKENKKSYNIYNYKDNELSGISFFIKDSINNTNKGMSLFHNYKNKADTLCYKHLKNYNFLNLKEINEKRYKWIFNNKRPPVDRNGVFQTYLIEIISDNKFVVYPVFWAGEGIID